MRMNFAFVFGIAYIALLVGVSWGQVGVMSTPAAPYPWHLPLATFGATGVPFVCGIFSGMKL